MRSITQPVVSVLDRLQRRFRRSRPGSVLILTVVMVVLLALLGTALLSTTGNDRYVATQNSVNVQIDMLVEGVKSLAKARILEDLWGTYPGASPTRVFRAPNDTAVADSSDYDHYDAPWTRVTPPVPNQPNDRWLASRAPYLPLPTGTQIRWPAISGPIHGDTFYSPVAGAGFATTFTVQAQMIPTYMEISGQKHPAWALSSGSFALAGDADGDGIADSGLVRAPIGEIEGVTYYYAIRIVDNNSAINVNTAWSSHYEFDFTETTTGGVRQLDRVDALGTGVSAGFAGNLGWFPTHVGLFELLHANTAPVGFSLAPASWTNNTNAHLEMKALNQFRFGHPAAVVTAGGAAYGASEDWIIDPRIRPNASANPALSPIGGAFITQGDAAWHQLGRRLGNPGYRTVNSSDRFRSFGIDDAGALAYRNGVVINLDSSRSRLEELFFNANPGFGDSVYRTAPNYKPLTGSGTGSIVGRKAYSPDRIFDWYDENYNRELMPGGTTMATALPPLTPATANFGTMPRAASHFRSIRSILTTFNPVSNLAPARYVTVGSPTLPSTVMPAYRTDVPKTNINTAESNELWRAFWSVMSDQSTTTKTPFIEPTSPPFDITADGVYYGNEFTESSPLDTPTDISARPHPQRMFRSPIRDPRLTPNPMITYLKPEEVVKLRAAIAASNAISLREMERGVAEPSNPSPVYDVDLLATIDGTADQLVTATIYRLDPQPFITEVYAQTDTYSDGPNGEPPNANPYIAIELYNPYPFDIPLNSTANPGRIVRVNRPQSLAGYPLTMTQIADLSTIADSVDAIVPANGYLLIENLDVAGAQYRPRSSRLPPTGDFTSARPGPPTLPTLKILTVPNLHEVLTTGGGEMVILKGGVTFDDYDARPIDSFDFTGVNVGSPANVLHYVRRNDEPGGAWQFVYPGRYHALKQRRHQGTQLVEFFPAAAPAEQDPFDPLNTTSNALVPVPTITFGRDEIAGVDSSNVNPAASYSNTFPIQLMNSTGDALHTPTTPPYQFPIGQFARDGDMLQIPFIGAYRITRVVGSVRELIELNPITIDSAFAEDTFTEDDPLPSDNGTEWREQIGRFCPIPLSPATGAPVIQDFGTDNSMHAYAFSRKLFDYLTTRAPASDYLPNVPPNRAPQAQPIDNDGDGIAADEDYVPSFGPPPENRGAEDTLPIHGLVNINTAPWPVLAAVPFLPAGQNNYTFNPTTRTWVTKLASDNVDDNTELAREIVRWRDFEDAPGSGTPGGPFRSILDLYKVPAFREIQRLMFLDTSATEPNDAVGDFTPPGALTDNVRRDFEELYLLVNRVSNLITTRSDSFTVYVLVQGWRDVGTAEPKLVAQRRATFIQDRSSVSNAAPNLPAAVNVVSD